MTRIFSAISAIIIAMAFCSAASAQTLSPDSTVEHTATEPADSVADTASGAMKATSASELVQRADSAYSADNFPMAETLYSEALRQHGSSSTLFYNLGNTYYRLGNMGMAIVSYERALRLDPSNNDARTNLAFVKGKITDRQNDEVSIMETLWESTVTFFKADTWAWISVSLFALFLAGVVTYLFAHVVMVRKISFFGGAVIFLLCVVSVIVSFAAANRTESANAAIILPPATQLSTSPREARTQSEEAFLLHEGTKVEIVDSVSTPGEGKWYEVRVAGRDRAWVKASEVERI
ncbi:MAG: tetratricopeptide repeat protein [Muribaculaceae bacterium]|nr:tetratricopeptide repeat protein [Muribaculaceae bacterium]